MKKKVLFLLALAFLVGRADGQTTVQVSPDCVVTFSNTASSVPVSTPAAYPTAGYDNRTTRCAYWRVTWETYGAGAAVSGTFQDAPSNNAGTAAGTFVTFAGSTASGSNPSTALNSTATFEGFYPWVRVNITAITGNIRGTIYGWKTPEAIGGGSGGGAATHVIVDSGSINATIVNQQVCNGTDAKTTLAVSASALNGSQQLVAASGSTRIYVCSFSIGLDTAVNFKLITGTGATCGTGTADLTGAYQSILGLALDSPFRTPASVGLCMNTSAAATIGGLLTYVQQ